ncbi:3'-5' exoribonuclease YhaM family protein [Dubosiella newyorkensis]|uniref:3'-5' exonuclease n=2 Tax=Dubosiella newyorkensis TaxID=1862672 RepID=A0A1U7NQ02_9FIRM|nr:HD domain-containing protein [Dubosiella newyorkensis]OLU47708.1 3'-5' exonuclease [Dubosiella newyorkensis]
MIKDIHEEGKIHIKALITKCDRGRTAKNTPYLSLILEDKSGILDAKFWNLTEEQIGQYRVGMVVEAYGEILFHKNATQLRVRKLIVDEEANLLDYVREAPMEKEAMEQEIDTIIANMKDSVIQEVVKKVLESVKERFYLYPAATRNHHNFVGGLAYHTICMARMAKPVVEQYPFLDEDLVLAGILLHDVGKVDELSAPMLPEYTNVGNLLGHISIMSNRIDRIATSLGYEDDERVILLKHLVLSHHGKLEYGSPVLPMIPEAEVLTILDNLDSRMYMMKQSIDASQPGTFGPRIYALDNRMIYHRKKEEQE